VVKRLLKLLVRSRLSGLPLPLPVLLKRRLKRDLPVKRKRVRAGPPPGVGVLGLVKEIAVVAAESAVSVEIVVVAGLHVVDKRRWEKKMTKLRVKWVKSAIGYSKDQKATIRALGLRKLQQTVEHEDNPALRGMIRKVNHLVKIEEVVS
jgi:large subunit ribosomal protein L30